MDVSICRVEDCRTVIVQSKINQAIFCIGLQNNIDTNVMGMARQISAFNPVDAKLTLGPYSLETQRFEKSLISDIQWPQKPPPTRRFRWF